MSSNNKERMLDLLTDQILFGLSEEESAELRELEKLYPELKNDNSLELTASAIGLTNLGEIEPMPESLRSKIMADADAYFANAKSSKVLQFQPQLREVKSEKTEDELQPTFQFEPKRPITQWLGWAFAGLACIALAVSIGLNLQKPKVVVQEVPVQPKVLTANEQYNQLLASAKDLRKVPWLNPKDNKEIIGEVVWSDAEQKGFMKFTGLAANDVTKEQYQLWIFDENQDEKTPIDGGVFDIKANGETLIPIDAKLKVQKPKLFAVTAEKPGGVVVSKREKIVAIGKVQA
jgi:hypothetical protein